MKDLPAGLGQPDLDGLASAWGTVEVIIDHDDDRRLDEVHARAFHRTSNLASVSTPTEGRLVDVNESFVHITGYDRDALIGREAEELGLWVDPEQRRRFLTELEDGLTVGGVDVELRAKDGTIRHVRGSAELVEAAGDLHVFAIAEELCDELARRPEVSNAYRAARALTEQRRDEPGARAELAMREERFGSPASSMPRRSRASSLPGFACTSRKGSVR